MANRFSRLIKSRLPHITMGGLCIICLTIIGWTGYTLEFDRKLDGLIDDYRHNLYNFDQNMSGLLEVPIDILLSLQGETKIRNALTTNDDELLASELEELIQRNKAFYQVRLIGLDGQEQIRFDRKGNASVKTPQQALQNKANRYYVLEAKTLLPGEVYVSQLDLNIENGIVELPHRPTIRLAALALDNNNEAKGIFLINRDMSEYLASTVFNENYQNLLIVTSDGNWIRPQTGSSHSGITYQFDGSYNLHSDTWQVINNNDKGTLKKDDGYMLWTTAWPSSNDSDALKTSTPYLKLISKIDPTLVDTIREQIKHDWSLPFLLLSLILIIFTLLLIRLFERHQIAEQKIAISEYEKSALRRIKQAEQEALLFLENSINGILIVNNKGIILTTNPALEKIFGYLEKELIGKSVDILVPDKDVIHHHSLLKNYVDNENQPRSMVGRAISGLKKNGTKIPLEISLSPIHGSEPKRVAATVVDLSERLNAEQKITHLQTHDMLTNLPNRFSLQAKIVNSKKIADKTGTGFLLIILDLDFFKHLNDSLGHSVGDHLLIQIANRLAYGPFQKDFIGRICGDEFVILVDGIHSTDAATSSIKKVFSMFEQPFQNNGEDIWLAASAGISIYPKDGNTPNELIRNTDSALSMAKKSGRNRYEFYSKNLTFEAQRMQKLENDLRFALQEKQLYLVFQPQIDARTETLIGVEALIRWKHPSLGLVSPAEFIPVAELTGLIHPIGAWVIEQACLTASKWLRDNIKFQHIAINIAAQQLNKGELPTVVKNALEKYKLPASYIELEVTESSAMNELEDGIDQLNKLKALGVSLSIDDFGTGYSSLAQLKALPFKTLKLDQSFIKGLPNDSNDCAIVKTVLALGENLELDVIAEGVETLEQLNFLIAHGCTRVQGYYFSKPLLKSDFEEKYRMAGNESMADIKASARHETKSDNKH